MEASCWVKAKLKYIHKITGSNPGWSTAVVLLGKKPFSSQSVCHFITINGSGVNCKFCNLPCSVKM